MQEFLTNDVVNCNLMSLTGYRTLVILRLLIESPKSNDEINNYFLNHKYIKETFSNDTLRIYINSLRAIGCKISRADRANKQKYVLKSHPFTYGISDAQIKSISKLYKNIYDKIDIKELINLEKFLIKIASLVDKKETAESLHSMLLLKNINKDILKGLLLHCKNNNQIVFLYNSPKSGAKEIEIVADKLSFKSQKLYLWGDNLTHKEYSYFAVSRILKICSIKLKKEQNKFPPTKIIYELYNHNDSYTPALDETIIEKAQDKLVIEVTAENEFNLMQRVLHMAGNCKVIAPEAFKIKLLDKLNAMKENYVNV